MKALYLPHGGGPLPLLGEPGHNELVTYLKELGRSLRPKAAIIVSAHWEADVASVQTAASPSMLFDYYGFPEESYTWQYPAAGNPALAGRLVEALKAKGIACSQDAERGFDHGLFIPLMLMWPEADIPVFQLSLLSSMDAEAHLQLGRALTDVLDEDTLLIGSGFSFHNLQAGLSHDSPAPDAANAEFEAWLASAVTSPDDAERWQLLSQWESAPGARYCHPREEHLLPLHVCMGAMGRPASRVDSLRVMGAQVSCMQW
jgi:aromatic ring-opening dioxygenase catalytic subunit (LigB family)